MVADIDQDRLDQAEEEEWMEREAVQEARKLAQVLGRWAGKGASAEGIQIITDAGFSRSELEKLTTDKKKFDATLQKPIGRVRGPACCGCCKHLCWKVPTERTQRPAPILPLAGGLGGDQGHSGRRGRIRHQLRTSQQLGRKEHVRHVLSHYGALLGARLRVGRRHHLWHEDAP